jgi:hypothetical protein
MQRVGGLRARREELEGIEPGVFQHAFREVKAKLRIGHFPRSLRSLRFELKIAAAISFVLYAICHFTIQAGLF